MGVRALAISVCFAGLLIGCASARPPADPAQRAQERQYRKDADRCRLATTRTVPSRCPGSGVGFCSVAVPDESAFLLCMEEKGWEPRQRG